MTAALEGGEWSAARPGCTLPLGKIQYPFYRRLDGPQTRSGRTENLVPTGIRTRTVQPAVRLSYLSKVVSVEKTLGDRERERERERERQLTQAAGFLN